MQIRPLCFFKTDTLLRDYRQTHHLSIVDLRKSIPIAVIDDEPFAAEVNLRNLGYNIKQIGDIKSISEIEKYGIVLCDLMGVGRHFDNTNQGATIIKEIREQYPSIFVISYSGNSLTSGPARAAKTKSDKIIRKDADIPEWNSVLDEILQLAMDPYIVWGRTKLRMITLGINTATLLILEDRYVSSILKQSHSEDSFNRLIISSGLPSDMRSIVQNLIASAIFKLMTG